MRLDEYIQVPYIHVPYLKGNDSLARGSGEEQAPGQIIKASKTGNDGEPIEKTQVSTYDQYHLKHNLSNSIEAHYLQTEFVQT